MVLSNSNYHKHKLKLKYENIIFQNTTTGEIETIIKSLPLKGSSGYDEVSTRILQISGTFISSPLCNIINKSLSSGIFPDRLKYLIVIPVHKKGDKNNVSNYRPISLLTAFPKIFEKVIYKRVTDHFLTNNILTKSQFGFIKIHQLQTQHINYNYYKNNYNYIIILQALNNKTKCGGIFFYLEKAFDCVKKISYYGVNDVFFSLIKSYLEKNIKRPNLIKIIELENKLKKEFHKDQYWVYYCF
jgi:predicted nucleic acid-binding protein